MIRGLLLSHPLQPTPPSSDRLRALSAAATTSDGTRSLARLTSFRPCIYCRTPCECDRCSTCRCRQGRAGITPSRRGLARYTTGSDRVPHRRHPPCDGERSGAVDSGHGGPGGNLRGKLPSPGGDAGRLPGLEGTGKCLGSCRQAGPRRSTGHHLPRPRGDTRADVQRRALRPDGGIRSGSCGCRSLQCVRATLMTKVFEGTA